MGELVEAIEDGITSRTRLILVSHMVNLGGQIYPIREICDLAHARGIEVVVDGAQSFGMLNFEMGDLGCDYFGTSLHKWLMAPKGTGALYIRRDKIASTWPLLPPPRGRENDVRKFEALGTIPATSLAIGEAIAFHNGIGADRKEERLRYLTRYWAERLARLPRVHYSTSFDPEMYCAIATVGIEGIEPHVLHEHLWEEHRIRVTNPSPRAENINGVRVSPGLHTTLDELDTFCDVMETISRNGL
jgi:selenocysteine lyase/cysteine desulfurase